MTEESETLNKIRGAVAELDAEHAPQWVAEGSTGYTLIPRDGYDPVGCAMCYPHDSSWPCVSRMIADDLRTLLWDEAASGECGCGRVFLGGMPTGSRNWDAHCPVHGIESTWYNSPEQIAKRQDDQDRLRELQLRAAEMRKNR